tara:strand:+ start:7244 stop:8740 length:1497 start_codon:yes stop_codon:yes gene_type:complete
MHEPEKKMQKQKKITGVTTFPVFFPLHESDEDININTNILSNFPKEEIVTKAFGLHSEGKIPEAVNYYKYCIQQGFNDHRVFSNYGIILKNLGKFDEAVILQRKAIQINPNFAEGYSNLANTLIGLGKLQEAESTITKAIQLKPEFAEAHSNLGLILKNLGRPQEAELSLRQAIQLKPDFANAYSNLGNTLTDLGKLEEAEKLQRKAIQINPDFAEAHSNLGLLLIDIGKLEEAEIHTQKAIQLDSQSATFKLNFGICQIAIGNLNYSLEIIESAHRIDSNNELTKCLLAILKGKKRIKSKDTRLEKIKDSLFNYYSNWNPVVLYRVVEEELIRKLYTIKTEEASNQDKYPRPIFGNLKGSNYDLFENNIPILKTLETDLIELLSKYFDSEIYITESFFNIIKPKDGIGGGNKIHNHLNRVDRIKGFNIIQQKFSLVYYLCTGDKDSNETGILNFHEPDQDFSPEEGMIVVFPASRLHSVSYNGVKDRVSLVVNFYII